uniref:Mitochondrial import receptor subunit TOM22 homolog n=1 Tax=Acrobeloides nanus TaxID=290746 RepID=A0A914E1Z9_9BILA
MAVFREQEPDWDSIPEDELNETFLERIEGLKEMFPEPLLKSVSSVANWTTWFASNTFWLTKSAVWVFATTGMIMVLPYALENENAEYQKKESEHQRQVLLGPTSAISSAKAGQ